MVITKLPIAAPIRVPAAPRVDSTTAEDTAPRAEPAAPTQLIWGPLELLTVGIVGHFRALAPFLSLWAESRATLFAAASRTARLTAETMALNDAVVIDGSIPTPHSVCPFTSASM